MNWLKDLGNAVQSTANQIGQTAKDIAEGVGNMAQDAVETLDEMVQGAGQAVRDADEAVGNFVQDASERLNKEINDVGQKMKDGDPFGAAKEALELFSPGVHVSNGLAALGFGEDNPFLQNVVSAAMNLATGHLAAVAKDVEDLIALAATETSGTTEPAPPHTPPPPCAHAVKVNSPKIELGLKAIFERLNGMAPGATHNCGWPGDPPRSTDLAENVKDRINNWIGRPDRIFQPLPGRIRDIIEGLPHAPDSEVAKLPRPCAFEDLVAAFMVDVMKAAQEDVKAKMEELERMNAQKAALNTAKQVADGVKMGAEVAGTVIGTIIAPGIGTAIGSGAGKMAGDAITGGEALSHKKEELEDSRQLLFEQMKNSMNRLQQMMQALSNVLNTMHEGAMNSIRNIK